MTTEVFEQAWQTLAQAGLTGRPWIERPWLDPIVLASGPLAIRVERALRETESLVARVQAALEAAEAQDHADAALLRHLHRARHPRWWQIRRAWDAAQTRERLALLQRTQQETEAMARALAGAQQGLEVAQAWVQHAQAERPSGEQAAWAGLADRLALARAGVATYERLVEAHQVRRSDEQGQWALLQVAQTHLPG